MRREFEMRWPFTFNSHGRTLTTINPLSDENVQRAVCLFGPEGEELRPSNYSPVQVDALFRRTFPLIEERILAPSPLDARCAIAGISLVQRARFVSVDFGVESFNEIVEPHSVFVRLDESEAMRLLLLPDREGDTLHHLVFRHAIVRIEGYTEDQQWRAISQQVYAACITPECQLFLYC